MSDNYFQVTTYYVVPVIKGDRHPVIYSSYDHDKAVDFILKQEDDPKIEYKLYEKTEYIEPDS